MAIKNHIHKYQYKNLGSKKHPRKVYACAYPDCTHFQPSINLVKGKESICHQCDKKMLMTPDIVRDRIVKPRCPACKGKIKEAEPEIKLDRAVEMLLALKG